MFTFFYLFGAIVLLMVLVGYAYRNQGPDATDAEQDRRLDRLATMLDPELMEGIIERAKEEGRSEIAELNHLLRLGLGRPPRS